MSGSAPGTATGRQPVLQVTGLRVAFGPADQPRYAVDGVTLSVQPGKAVALVGESGCGKSLTSLALLRLPPEGARVTADELLLDGTDLMGLPERALEDIRGRRIAMVFQNPMSALNPVQTIGNQITDVLRRHTSLTGKAIPARVLDLLRMVEMADPLRRVHHFPHQLSGGMRQRAMIALALAAEPDVLIADEPTTALDVTLQAQIMALLKRLQHDLRMALILITHDLGVVAQSVDIVNVMYAGRIVERADVRTVFRKPAHPYTIALLEMVKDLAADHGADLHPIPGVPPAPVTAQQSCSFAARCPMVFPRCRVERPLLRSIGTDHVAACHLTDQSAVSEGATS